jgi:hypothetical protein
MGHQIDGNGTHNETGPMINGAQDSLKKIIAFVFCLFEAYKEAIKPRYTVSIVRLLDDLLLWSTLQSCDHI